MIGAFKMRRTQSSYTVQNEREYRYQVNIRNLITICIGRLTYNSSHYASG
jgi:hypothetical protein